MELLETQQKHDRLLSKFDIASRTLEDLEKSLYHQNQILESERLRNSETVYQLQDKISKLNYGIERKAE